MAATTTVTFYAFLHYLKNNPFKSAGGMNNGDIDAMAKLFSDANSTEITATADTTAVDGTYTDIEWPDASGGASSITAKRDTPTINQAHYPEKHFG